MAPSSRRQLANAGAAFLLAIAFVVSLTGFRRPPGWVGVTQQLSFATDLPRPGFEEAELDDEGWPIERVEPDRDRLFQEVNALRDNLSTRVTSVWLHESPRSSGSFVRERWCRPEAGSTECFDPDRGPDEGDHGESFHVDLVMEDSPSRRVIGYVFVAQSVSGLVSERVQRLRYAQGGGRVIRPGLDVELTDGRDGLRFGTTYELRAGPLTCVMGIPGYVPQSSTADRATSDELQRLLASPTSLHDTVSSRLMMLLEFAEATLSMDETANRVCSLDLGDTSTDREALRQEIHQTIEGRLDVLSRNSASIHQWLSASPPAALDDE